MEKIIISIIRKYNQLFSTNYDEDNFNISVFSVLLNVDKNNLLKIGLKNSVKELGNRMLIQIGYINFLRDKFFEKLPFSDAIKEELLNYSKKNITELKLNGLKNNEKQKALEKLFIILSLNDIIDHIMMTKYGYVNEIEKFFSRKIGNKKDRIIRQEQISQFDISYHFGNLLDKDSFNKKALLYFFASFHNENFKKLKLHEKQFLWRIYRISLKKYNIDRQNLKIEFNNTYKYKSTEILNKKIKISDATIGFKKFIRATNLKIKISTSANYSNFAANFKEMKIPTGKDFKYISLEQFVILCAHEIETHNYCYHNTLKSTGKRLTMPGNNTRDEGLAKINELLLFGLIDKKRLPNHNMLRLFIGKEFGGKTYLYFLKLLEKIDNNATGLEKRFLRYKKFYSSDLQGTFSRDVSYEIGEIWAKNYLGKIKKQTSIIPYLALGFLRVGYNNLHLSEKYLKNKLIINKVDISSNIEVLKFFDKKGYTYRGFYSDYLLYLLTNEQFNIDDFKEKIYKNYDFLPNDVIEYMINKIPTEKLDELAIFLQNNYI